MQRSTVRLWSWPAVVVLLAVGCGGASGASPTPSSTATSVSPSPSPSPCPSVTVPAGRLGAALTYDGKRGEFLLFGGDVSQAQSMGASNDTWISTSGCWAQQSPVHTPQPRSNAVASFDPVRNVVVLYGGEYDAPGVTPTFLNETWLWAGTDWNLVRSSPTPSLVLPVGAFDIATGQLIVFGTPPSGPPAQTWAWDGSNWSLLHPQMTPPARTDASASYDSATRQVVLFGGYNASLGTLGDTWTWDGTTWQEQHPSTSPGARSDAEMCGGPSVVLFGGTTSSGVSGDTWVWSGGNWVSVAPQHLPPPRRNGSCASDGTNIVMFGGQGTNGQLLNDSWKFVNGDWALGI
jgi:Galactose oxidase, central domain